MEASDFDEIGARALHIDPAALERARKLAERRLSADEFLRLEAQPISAAERDETLALVRWFRGRYKTPAERLAYVRRAYRRWMTLARR